MPALQLSLEHFDPLKQPPPYITTPRSIEACKIHGVQPQELLHRPLQDFRESADEPDDVVWYRYMRHEEGRKLLLQRVRRTREELVHGRSSGENVETTPTLVIQQAKHVAWTEQRELFELQKMIARELQQAHQLQAWKQNLEKQDTVFEKIDEKRQQLQQKLHDYRKQLIEDAAEKERESQRRLARAKALERKKAMQEKQQQRENELKAKQDAEHKEAMRVRAAQELKQSRERILKMQEMQHQDKLRQLMERASLREHRGSAQQQARDAMKEARFREAARKREQAAEAMRNRENAKLRATTESVDEYERRAQARREQLEAMREEMRAHAARMEEEHRKRKEQLDERSERQKAALMAKLQQKQQDSAAARAKTKAMRRQHAELQRIRQEEWRQNQQRVQRAKSYQIAQVTQNVELKELKHAAVQSTKRGLEHVTSNLKQTIRKTRSELKEEFAQLRKMDAYTPDAILEVVDRVADEVLIPRIEATWQEADRVQMDPQSRLLNKATISTQPSTQSQRRRHSLRHGPRTPEHGRSDPSTDTGSDTDDDDDDDDSSQPSRIMPLRSDHLTQRPTTAPEFVQHQASARKSYSATAREPARRTLSPPTTQLRQFAPAVNKSQIMQALVVENERLKQQQHFSSTASQSSSLSHSPKSLRLPASRLKPPSRLELCWGDTPKPVKRKQRKRRRSKFTASLEDYEWNMNSSPLTERTKGTARETTSSGKGGSVEQLKLQQEPTSERANLDQEALSVAAAVTDRSPPGTLHELHSSFTTLTSVRKSQNQLLMALLSQEEQAEVDRQDALAKCTNQEERQALELTFAEERTRASQRILKLTQEHQAELRQLNQAAKTDIQQTEQ